MTENTNTKNVRGIASAPRNGSILNLNLQCKQTIVDLIQDVVNGKVSMRRAATEIQKHVPKKRLTANERKMVKADRKAGVPVNVIALNYDIDPATVWRICKSNKQHEARG